MDFSKFYTKFFLYNSRFHIRNAYLFLLKRWNQFCCFVTCQIKIFFHLEQLFFRGQEDNHYVSHVNFRDILNHIQQNIRCLRSLQIYRPINHL